MSSVNVDGPRIEFRPALPHVPAAGAMKAAGLAYESLSTGTAGVPVSEGRTPTVPVPGTATKTSGVTGSPLPLLSCAVIVQSL